MQLSSLPLLVILAILVLSISALLWSSDRFVSGAADIAIQLGVSPMVIGLTLVSLGTSAPEILVSATAAIDGVAELAVGNALGSNLANTGMVLAITALLIRIPVTASTLKGEILAMLLVTLGAGAVLYNGYLGRIESILLMLAAPLFLYLSFKRGALPDPEELIEDTGSTGARKPLISWAVLLIGLIGLILSSKVLVSAAVETATRAGVSELIIGATLVAVGTSLPELAASLTSAIKGKTDMALGNVVGSNIFNLLLVLPIAGIISPTFVSPDAFNRDFGILMLMSLILAGVCAFGLIKNKGTAYIGRGLGLTLLIIYILYYYKIFS